MITTLGRLWRGELPLADAFWTFVCAYGLLVNLLCTALSLALYLNFEAILPAIIAHLIPLPYNTVAIVGAWRSADRYEGHSPFVYLVKATLILAFGVMLFL